MRVLTSMHGWLDARSCDERGATAVEYGMLLALIVVLAMTAITLLGTHMRDMYDALATLVGK